MTLEEFQTLASAMGAEYVFKTAPAAVFKNTIGTLTMELSSQELAHAKPVEVAYVMADLAMKN